MVTVRIIITFGRKKLGARSRLFVHPYTVIVRQPLLMLSPFGVTFQRPQNKRNWYPYLQLLMQCPTFNAPRFRMWILFRFLDNQYQISRFCDVFVTFLWPAHSNLTWIIYSSVGIDLQQHPDLHSGSVDRAGIWEQKQVVLLLVSDDVAHDQAIKERA